MTDGRDAETLEGAIARIDALLPAEDGTEDALEAVVTGFGRYDGLPPRVAFLSDGRGGTLLEPITYTREEGGRWPVPGGAALDGASIPRAFWTLIGGPFEGKYRDASIVHDHYCVVKERAWADTHRMFYEAMRCSGVGKRKAGVMFYAVHRFGPRWPDPSGEGVEGVAPAHEPHDADADTLVRDAEAIVERDMDADEIAALADRRAPR